MINKIKDMFYDYYNHRWRTGGIVGTLTTGTAHNGSGTFLVIIRRNDGEKYRIFNK